MLSIDLQFFAGEKTEKATPKKRQDVRKKGQTAKSQEINTAFVLLAVFFSLFLFGSFILGHFLDIFRETFNNFMFQEVTELTIRTITYKIIIEIMKVLAPVMLAAIVAALVANYIQVGFLFSSDPLKMKLERLDPIKGAKRIFSLRAIVELLKSILKISFVGVIAFAFLWMNMPDILRLIHQTTGNSLVIIATITGKMGLFSGIALLFLAIFDYIYQRYDFEKNIRMSKQDIKDELKNIEGDPLIKSKIKQKQREMAMRRMMQEVPKADVVITNPTHYAVAIKYDETLADAPIVVAKGVDFVAQKIIYIAKENDVYTVENRPLARALYAQVEIGDAIPEEFFKAVAEILAYVYRLRNKV
ncbi:flagellar biosynthesis protein FlhB [Fervidibacillus halotolerans]|uniref:Flagellar biosynthetic protein FlhB n=1 Tax=Fervidibacillus halotolerans TaxID=2980027 RepID=A0A9E8M136_9BACI|nr:flagellar biosynthesis protein FlhB [Fervidibacillus halotolerans]WAA13588.1 flagellar biosynthesis protein FlhB [Fervidibacillus halotolerans]